MDNYCTCLNPDFEKVYDNVQEAGDIVEKYVGYFCTICGKPPEPKEQVDEN